MEKCDTEANQLDLLMVPILSKHQSKDVHKLLSELSTKYLTDEFLYNNDYNVYGCYNRVNKLIGTSSLFFLYKPFKTLPIAQIEDVVVSKEYQGWGVGRYMIDYLINQAKKRQAYKIILSCSDYNLPFYIQCGFTKQENSMVKELL